MPAAKTRTLYVRDEDKPMWDKARELIGDSFSSYIAAHLRQLVTDKEAENRGFERIVLRYREKGLPRAKAFMGQWLISPQEPYVWHDPDYDQDDYAKYAVAITPKNKVIVFAQIDDSACAAPAPPGEINGRLWVFDTFEEANDAAEMNDFPAELIGIAMDHMGTPVEELDV